MNAPKIAVVSLFLLSGIAFVVPWGIGFEIRDWPDVLVWGLVGGILVALFVLGRAQRLEELALDTWVDDPRKSKLQNWMAKRRQRFSPKRGVQFFFFGLIGFSIMVGISALSGELASIVGAVAFAVLFSLLAGLIGMFTENVPF
jgi:hypothetical protein